MQALLSRFTHHSSNLQPSKIAWELVSFPRRRPYRGTTGPKSPAPLRSRAAGGVGKLKVHGCHRADHAECLALDADGDLGAVLRGGQAGGERGEHWGDHARAAAPALTRMGGGLLHFSQSPIDRVHQL